METKGRLKSISRDWNTGKVLLTFEIDDEFTEANEEEMRRDLRIRTTRWKNVRSLDANAYYHVLCRKIAQKLGVAINEICNKMIAEYGQYEVAEHTGLIERVAIADGINWERLDSIHLRPTAEFIDANNGTYRVYYVMRGSHTYDTEEMSMLLNGVVQEAKALNIETITPNEILRMISAWRNSNEKKHYNAV